MDLQADKKPLQRLLGQQEEQFRIPPYQRPYSWTADQVDDLWEDLRDNVASGHFLGSLVLATEGENRPVVIDGQQRLTTLMILLAALRDASFNRGMTQHANKIQQRLIADDFASGDDRFKFKTGSMNWKVFRDFILRSPDDPERRDIDALSQLESETQVRNRALTENLTRMKRHVRDHLASMADAERETWLREFTRQMLNGVELVVIEVGKLSDAFLLFETLNDRGLQLSAADLLKSHLLGQVSRSATDEEVDEAALEWDQMLDDLGANADVSRFLRHYLLGYLQSVRKDQVFDYFKRLIAQRGAIEVLEELRTVARYYGEFETPSKVQDEATRDVLKDLQTLRAATCYIALLPARRYLSTNDFIEFARLCEVLTFRYSSVAGLSSKDLERRYRDAAQALIVSDGTSLERARSVLIDTMPDSETFTLAFERLAMGTQYLLRYTMQRIEMHLHTTKELKLQPNNLVHIEHIMPKALTPEWHEALGIDGVDQHQEYLNRYGNLTLFYSGLNIPASNKPFSEKKPYYQQSQVELTKQLTTRSRWDIDAIRQRQRELAELADEVWAKPEAASAPSDVATDALTRFRQALGEAWESVEPGCQETSPESLAQWREILPGYLADDPRHSGTARPLGSRLLRLLDRWDDLDASERRVLAGGISYLLQPDDAIPDRAAGGLADDDEVIAAAEEAIGSGGDHRTDASAV